jgi:uncharacterized protein GlcG (DUF336 family)
MFKKDVIGMDEARLMVETVLRESKKMSPELPVAVAVVDGEENLVYFAREDGAYPLYCHMAICKAYTAARVNTNTGDWAKFQKESGREIASWLTCDPNMTGIQGGVVIKQPGGTDGSPNNTLSRDKLGGIGVSGKWAKDDEKLALLAVKAFHDAVK